MCKFFGRDLIVWKIICFSFFDNIKFLGFEIFFNVLLFLKFLVLMVFILLEGG